MHQSAWIQLCLGQGQVVFVEQEAAGQRWEQMLVEQWLRLGKVLDEHWASVEEAADQRQRFADCCTATKDWPKVVGQGHCAVASAGVERVWDSRFAGTEQQQQPALMAASDGQGLAAVPFCFGSGPYVTA